MIVFRLAALTPFMMLAACATTPAPVALAPPVCEDLTVTIYFERDSADLIPEARGLLRDAAQESRTCKVDEVHVRGLSDAIGDPDVNLVLSKARAETVSKALAEEGLGAATFDVGAVGERGAVTLDGEAKPLRRRVDVAIHRSMP